MSDNDSNNKHNDSSNRKGFVEVVRSTEKPIIWLWHGIRQVTWRVIISLAATIILGLFATQFTSLAWVSNIGLSTNTNTPISVRVKFNDSNTLGYFVELYPLGLDKRVNNDGNISFETLTFGDIKNKTLQLRLGRRGIRKTIAEINVGEKPPMLLYFYTPVDSLFKTNNMQP